MSTEERLEILVVDDDPAIRGALRRALEGAGHAVQEAADAAEGLARLDPRATDVVLLAINMPGLDGLDALERFREQARVGLAERVRLEKAAGTAAPKKVNSGNSASPTTAPA